MNCSRFVRTILLLAAPQAFAQNYGYKFEAYGGAGWTRFGGEEGALPPGSVGSIVNPAQRAGHGLQWMRLPV